MGMTIIDGDLWVKGNVSGQSMTIPAGSVTNSAVKAAAGMDQSKLQHQHRKSYNQAFGSAVAAETRTVHIVYGATGTILAFRASLNGLVCAGAAVITVDLKKNGASILSAVLTFNSTHTLRQILSGTFSSAALVAGDVLDVVVTAVAGGGTLGQGLGVDLVVAEDAQ